MVVSPNNSAAFLTLRELAARHHCSIDAAREFLRRHRVPLLRPSKRRILIPLAAVERIEHELEETDPPRLPLAVRAPRKGRDGGEAAPRP